MYKTAIAHIEGQASYGEALNTFRNSYPEYQVRGLKVFGSKVVTPDALVVGKWN